MVLDGDDVATISGDIGLMPLTDLVIWIANRSLSCTLAVRRRGLETRFVIRDGNLVQAISFDPREYLGQHLINFGHISEEQLQRAFDTQRETNVPLGRVLCMVDAVTPEQLDRVLMFKTREGILETMSWLEGAFKVTDDVPPTRELDCPHPLSLHEVHSEATARASMWGEIRSVFPTDATRVDVHVDPQSLTSGFDRRLVQLMAMGRSIGEASLELRAMDFQTYARLYDLFNRKAVNPRTQTPAPAVASAAKKIKDARATTPMTIGKRTASSEEAARIPAEARDPGTALRVALAGRNWSEAMLLSQRILERDPKDIEAVAALRVADAQLKKSGDDEVDMALVPLLALPREQLALAHLTSKERYVLSRVDGLRSLQQIAAVSPIHRTELARIVSAFASKGVLRFVT